MADDFMTATAKSWLRSKGAVGALLATVLGLLITFQTTGEVDPVISAELVGLIISAGIAGYGRVTAKRPLKL